jgi:glycosyltransferase involved in cell wall biosynthesis
MAASPRAPDFTLASLSGARLSLADWRGRRVHLIFVQPSCPYSRALLPVIAGLHPDPPSHLPRPVVITYGAEDENRHFFAEYHLCCPVLLSGDTEVAFAFRAEETPAGCLIDESGRMIDVTRTGAINVLTQADIMPGPTWSWSTTWFQPGDYWHKRLVAPLIEPVGRTSELDSSTPETIEKDVLPLVSVIMTTRDRPRLLPLALECYRRQTYRRRELIVVDDGARFPADEDAIAALGGRLIRVPEGTPLGVKLNQGIGEARGALCQKWDDDDWYGPRFLDELVAGYLRSNATVCRPTVAFQIRRYWFDLARCRVLVWPSDEVAGGTLLFARQDWERHPFREIKRCVDLWFVVDQVRGGARPVSIDAPETHVYVRHDAAGNERGHTWDRWRSGDRMDDYLRGLPPEDTDPAAVFPDWALAAYAALSREQSAASHPAPSSIDSAAKPNLLYLSPVTPNVTGNGPGTRAGMVLEALAERYSIYLIVIPPRDRRHNWVPLPTATLCRDWVAVQPQSQRGPYSGPAADTIQDVAGRFRDVRFAAVHTLGLSMAPYAEPYLDTAAAPVWHMDLECIDSERQRQVAKRYRDNGLAGRAAAADREAAETAATESRILPRCARVYVSSSRDRERLKELHDLASVDILPNAVRLPLPLPPKPPKDAFSFLFAGTAGGYPDEDAIMFIGEEVLPLLRRTAPRPFEITIIGEGVMSPAARRISAQEELKLVRGVKRMEPWYLQADAVIMPYRVAGGTQPTVLEAMSYRRPIVSTSWGVDGLDVTDGKHVLVGDTGEALADSCLRLMSEPNLAVRLTESAYELCVHHHSPEVMRSALGAAEVQPVHA